jgi:hypothetical protein
MLNTKRRRLASLGDRLVLVTDGITAASMRQERSSGGISSSFLLGCQLSTDFDKHCSMPLRRLEDKHYKMSDADQSCRHFGQCDAVTQHAI